MNTLTMTLHALPDLEAVGGNARPGHYIQEHRNFKAEKAKWYYLIREEIGPPPMPRFEKAHAEVWLYFKERRNRDQDNCTIALKPFFDALVAWDMIPDDDDKHLTYMIHPLVVPMLAPKMVVVLTELEE